jgi:hypothetical protein
MEDFIRGIEPEQGRKLINMITGITDQKAMLSQVLAKYGARSPGDILKGILSGDLGEHPAYEDYLSAISIESSIEELRKLCRDLLERV